MGGWTGSALARSSPVADNLPTAAPAPGQTGLPCGRIQDSPTPRLTTVRQDVVSGRAGNALDPRTAKTPPTPVTAAMTANAAG